MLAEHPSGGRNGHASPKAGAAQIRATIDVPQLEPHLLMQAEIGLFGQIAQLGWHGKVLSAAMKVRNRVRRTPVLRGHGSKFRRLSSKAVAAQGLLPLFVGFPLPTALEPGRRRAQARRGQNLQQFWRANSYRSRIAATIRIGEEPRRPQGVHVRSL